MLYSNGYFINFLEKTTHFFKKNILQYVYVVRKKMLHNSQKTQQKLHKPKYIYPHYDINNTLLFVSEVSLVIKSRGR